MREGDGGDQHPACFLRQEFAGAYLERLDLALRAGRELGVRLYPLATYPLLIAPSLRKDLNYELQALTLGRERFLNAAQHTGVHLHLEVPERTIDLDTVVSRDAPEAANRFAPPAAGYWNSEADQCGGERDEREQRGTRADGLW